jgi:hypothetical protein
MVHTNADLDNLLCAVLREEGRTLPWGYAADIEPSFLERAYYHGLSPLLFEYLRHFSGWPSTLVEATHRTVTAGIFWEVGHHRLLGDVLDQLAAASIRPILFKGTALAYGVYANPVWRTRADTDLIVQEKDRRRTGEILSGLGFQRATGVTGEVISYQESYSISDVGGGRHVIDLHWRINNSEFLSRMFSYEELAEYGQTLPRLHGAIAAGPVHALLLACMHTATHRQIPYYVNGAAHYGGDRLIWLYDIHLIARSLSPSQWKNVAEIAAAKGLRQTTRECLELATRNFGTPCPAEIRAELSVMGEPAAAYMAAGAIRRGAIDFWAIDGVTKKTKFVRELLFPSQAYMREKYAVPAGKRVLLLFIRRIFEGLTKRFAIKRKGSE